MSHTNTPNDDASEDWNRRVWRLAGPIILSNLSIPLLGAVDMAVVGRLPDPAYIGGVAIGGIIFNYVYWGFGFLRMGTTGITAQAFGSDDPDEVRASLVRALLLAAGLGVLLLAFQGLIAHVGFGILDTSAQVERQARLYYAVRIWAAPAALANYAIMGWLFGIQRTGATLVLQVFQNGLNMVLDILFVLTLRWGVPGVAAATVISQYAGLLVGLLLIARLVRGLGGRFRRDRLLRRSKLRTLVSVNRDIFLRTLVLITGFSYFTQRGALLGDVTLAANAILLQFQNVQAYGLDAFAHAAEILVGNAAGAKDRRAFRRSVRTTTRWAAGIAVVYTLVYAAFGHPLIHLMTNLAAVREVAFGILPWAIVSPIISVWSFQLDGIFIGATRAREMRNGMILAFLVFVAAIHFLVPTFGNHGLWLALMVFMAARAGTLIAWYPRVLRGLDGS